MTEQDEQRDPGELTQQEQVLMAMTLESAKMILFNPGHSIRLEVATWLAGLLLDFEDQVHQRCSQEAMAKARQQRPATWSRINGRQRIHQAENQAPGHDGG